MEDIVQPTICLPSELWLEIFVKTTERDNLSHSRLETARRCSQVCQLWRTLLLSSAHIWGRLMELDYLGHATDEWKELVLSRVGNALLWITGRISSTTWRFFVKLLDEKWENVQILEVLESPGTRIYPEGTGAFLGRPAPNLVSLNLRLYNRFPMTQTFTLFSNFAPRLREIETSFVLNINPPFTWLSNLHRISFHANYTSSNILSILQVMPQLRRLRIWRGQSSNVVHQPEGVSDIIPIRLPRLQSLQIFHCTQSDALPFLELIKPSPTCSITILTTCSPPVNNPDSYVGIQDPSSRFYCASLPWILAYMKARGPRSISLAADDLNHVFRMLDHRSPQISQLYKLEEECLDIKVHLDNYCHSALAELARSSDIFSSVRQLSLFVDKHDSWVPLYNAFSSVTELTLCAYKIDLTALHADHKEQKQSILFPQLRSLRVVLEGSASALDSDIVPGILDFMENRAGVGLPLSCFHLLVQDPGPRIALSDNDKERLANLPGLSVKISHHH
ncbi:hypothetical protein D9613_011865 [Agrocybe pediades]|uniref:F-box domain-containing protein n=1 Tax=Agrocybe pediades TaxID=84607 RepID=A0A8H4QKC2_9AGAR|nr:hypothetical protein D9613_011865 [Agrocybe pediades]